MLGLIVLISRTFNCQFYPQFVGSAAFFHHSCGSPTSFSYTTTHLLDFSDAVPSGVRSSFWNSRQDAWQATAPLLAVRKQYVLPKQLTSSHFFVAELLVPFLSANDLYIDQSGYSGSYGSNRMVTTNQYSAHWWSGIGRHPFFRSRVVASRHVNSEPESRAERLSKWINGSNDGNKSHQQQ